MIHYWGWPWEWAISYGPYRTADGDHGAGWRTFITGRLSSGGHLRGYPMRLLDVYRHLSGHSYSLGMTSRVRSDWLSQEQNAHKEQCFLNEGRAIKLWNPAGILTDDELASSCMSDIELTYWEHRFLRRETNVRSIRIDIDCDDVWGTRDQRMLRAQVRACATLAEQLGLGFSVFRTGGRGIQAIYSLPWPQTPLSASWLSAVLRDALSIRLAGLSAVVDCDSTRAILRLPLGLHAKSGLLGLFLSPVSGEILPLEEQVRFSTKAFAAPRTESRSVLALQAIRLAFDSIGDNLTVVSDDAEQTAWEHLPFGSEFLQVLVDGRATPLPGREKRVIPLGVETSDDHLIEAAEGSEALSELPLNYRTRAWAIWNRGYGQGGSNSFHVNGGVAIAKLLFGDAARERLRLQAEQAPYRIPQDLADRFARIDHLLNTQETGLLFTMWSGTGSLGSCPSSLPDPDESDVRDGRRLVSAYRKIMRALGKKVQRRTMRVVEALASVVLASISRGNGIVSARALVSKLDAMDVRTNRTTVSEILDVLSSQASTSDLPPAALLEWTPIESSDPTRKPARRYSLASLH